MTHLSSSVSPTPLLSNAAGIASAARLLRDGKLVVLPTETVYGIALNLLSPDARAAARAIKANPSTPAAPNWVLHVAQPDDVLSWVPNLSHLGRRLITKALPGPVAFQIKLSDHDARAARERLGDAADETLAGGYLTIRCPEFPVTQQVLAEAGAPIAIIGAGTPAQPAVFEFADLPESLRGGPGGEAADDRQPSVGGRVAAALDGGPTRYRRASTLVRIDGEQFSVVREGVIDARIIERFADFLVLFICSGNTCRSPMAASLAAKMLADKLGIRASELPLRHVVVQSAGVHAQRGMRAAREAAEAVKTFGADLSSHISQSATLDLLRRADVIYTMTDAHREEVLDLLTGAAKKTHRLDPAGDIDDPIGAGLPVYQQVAGHLAHVLGHRLTELQI